ncbi:hypothetical protein PF008_g21888 [Phytophthora fragariae]|uniref:Uncharacterized protein n=1 Tax=Phytophthora fragariae TaxID=53985 RepID=A0A6G0QVA5_9STRA|nr:hypothetical protein PF008_g21888 [Phytophthora fragariae]
MGRKWFLLVGKDGKALTSATSVDVGIEDVVTLRDTVFAEVSCALPATVIASDLTVFANGSAYDAKQKPLKSSSAVNEFGKDVSNALIVQVPTQRRVDPATDILPQATGLSHLNRALGFLFKMEID